MQWLRPRWHLLGVRSQRLLGSLILRILLLTMLGATVGCQFSNSTVDTSYGRAGRTSEAGGINGLSVLYALLDDQGHRVEVSRRWGRSVKNADAVIWCLSNATSNTPELQQAIDKWFQERPGRRLIVVLPGYDAVVPYWKSQIDRFKPTDVDYILARNEAARAISNSENLLSQQEQVVVARVTFDFEEPRMATTLSSVLASSNDAAEHRDTELEVLSNGSIQSGVGEVSIRPLLRDRERLLVAEATSAAWPNGKVFLAANGSFLLNFPLTKGANREMLSRFLREVSLGKRVVFLEADGQPSLTTGSSQHHMLTAFGIFPLNVVLLHAMAAGFIYCFAVFPIFGRPRQLAAPRGTDFSLHPKALGRLLSRLKERESAEKQIQEWKQLAPQDTHLDAR
jgi:hypothetical protein